MIYRAYRNGRNAAWQCLIDFNMTRLPVEVIDIAIKIGIKIVKNSDANVLKLNESGISLFKDNQWYIIFNDKDIRQRYRFTIAHELGHIFLGHTLKAGRYARTFDLSRPIEETEADIFASRLLAPACVLWGLNLHTPQEIASACDISLRSAEIRAERMKILYKRNKFLTSPLEKQVYGNFKEFIKEYPRQYRKY